MLGRKRFVTSEAPDFNRQFSGQMLNSRVDDDDTRLPQIKPKTKRKAVKSHPFISRTSRECNKENMPTSSYSSSSKDSCIDIKVNGLRNRSTNSFQRNICPLSFSGSKVGAEEGGERLTDKPQTYEDLSCHFQNKGTKEMRQIIGADNTTGLKNFFSQYPSLFTIDGEYVTITCYNSGGGNGSLNGSKVANSNVPLSGKRDGATDAVAYFQHKLEQYGEAEVPIRSLLGHRSQAVSEIRQISGQNLKEFTEFLSKYPETFVIHNNYVVLRKHWDNIRLNAERPPPHLPDPHLIACALNLFHQIISCQGPTSVENLFAQLGPKLKLQPAEIQPQLSQLIKNSTDLQTFLRNHNERFLVQNGVVFLASQKFSGRTVSTSTPASSEPLVFNSPTLVLTTPANSIMSFNHTIPSPNHSFKSRLEPQQTKADQHVLQLSEPTTSTKPDVELNSSYVHKPVKVISTVKECQLLIAQLKTFSLISFAAEGVSVGSVGPISLLQIGTSNGNIFILDIQTCKELITVGGLKELLESPDIKKVVHDCRHISAALHYQFNVSLVNVFDTQAAHFVISLKTTNKPEHKIKNISFDKLTRMYGVKKAEPSKPKNDLKFWSCRPLTNDMISCATDHISSMIPNVYETMSALLNDENSLQRLQQLSWEQINYYIQVHEVRLKKKQRKVEFEVEELKEKLSRANGHVVLSNREIRLLRFVNLNKQERAKLEDSRKVSRKLERLRNTETDPIFANFHSRLSISSSSDDEDDFKGIDLARRYDPTNESEVESENGVCSFETSASPSLEDTIRIVENFLASDELGRLRQNSQSDGLPPEENNCCNCKCHPSPKKTSVACQTTSTSDIVITKVYFEDARYQKISADANIIESRKQDK